MATRRTRREFPPAAYLVRQTIALCVLACSLVVGDAAHSEELTLEIIALRHSLARDIKPLIQPFLAEHGTMTGIGDQLVIKTSPANLVEIKQVLAAFDRPPTTLRITVKQDVAGHSTIQEDALSGRLRSGDVRARVGTPGLQRGAQINIGDGRGNGISYRSINTRSSNDNYNTHFVSALEGRPALIQTGQSFPIPFASATYNRLGTTRQEGVEYIDVSSGFYVTATTSGQRVTLEIAPQLERADPQNRGAIDVRYSSSSVSGELGEWIPLGGSNDDSSDEQRHTLARTRQHGASTYGVWVKVEEIY
jgi:type II secretory pathway component GspD/PulD (secretin)